MLQKVEMYTIVCDNCGEDAGADSEYSCWSDDNYAEENAMDSGWLKEDKKHYCPKCYSYDDNDKLVITKLSVRGNVLVDQSDKCDGINATPKKSN